MFPCVYRMGILLIKINFTRIRCVQLLLIIFKLKSKSGTPNHNMKIQRDIRPRRTNDIPICVLRLIICYTYFQFSLNNNFVNTHLMHDSRFLRYFLCISLIVRWIIFLVLLFERRNPYFVANRVSLFFCL